jgi:hypothetical protein
MELEEENVKPVTQQIFSALDGVVFFLVLVLVLVTTRSPVYAFNILKQNKRFLLTIKKTSV